MPDETDFEQDITINENQLDVEWQRQAELTGKWARKHALAKTRRIRAEQKHKVLKADNKWAVDQERADVDYDIRRNPGDYSLPATPGETAIAHAINRDKEFRLFVKKKEQEVKDAFDEYLICVQDEELYAAAVKAMTDRKKALENLEQLYITNYYGEPKSTGFSKDSRLARAQQTGHELRDGLRNKRGDRDG